MKILNYGSINMDLVFSVPHIVVPGETISSAAMQRSAGGKGANQSVAIAKAGISVHHAGVVGSDGKWLVSLLHSYGVDTTFIGEYEGPTGQAFIQLSDQGQNSIVLFPGGNNQILRSSIDATLEHFGAGDVVLLQNEINEIPYLMEQAHRKGMSIWFNPAPISEEVSSYPLSLVSVIVVNEIEGMALSRLSEGVSYHQILDSLVSLYPKSEIILTVGKDGAWYGCQDIRLKGDIVEYPVVDTTGAGDTFIGYFLAARIKGYSTAECLTIACKASSIKVSRYGAMEAMPKQEEVFS